MGKKAGMAIHPESGFQESRAVRILEDKLEEGQRIRTFFKENDRTPNHDGFFEFVAADIPSRIPVIYRLVHHHIIVVSFRLLVIKINL